MNLLCLAFPLSYLVEGGFSAVLALKGQAEELIECRNTRRFEVVPVLRDTTKSGCAGYITPESEVPLKVTDLTNYRCI